MIHCIGDSHVSVFTGKDEMPDVWHPNLKQTDITKYFKAYRIGPATATGIASKIPIINAILEKVDKYQDKILFCFGEVDIRAHIVKEIIEKNKNDEELIQFSVNEYIKIISFYKKLGYNVMVWAPIASWSDSKPYDGPSWGDNIKRNEITKKFNKYLENMCEENKISFISIFDEMLLDNGETNPIYLDNWDKCHIHLIQTAFPLILKKFKEKKIILDD